MLIWKLKSGNRDALCRIYEKYKNDLLALAISLSNDRTAAEDVVHDVFVSFAEFAKKLQLRTSLKSYISSCVTNRVRSLSRARQAHNAPPNETSVADSSSNSPEQLAISAEELRRIGNAMAKLPCPQREVIILRLQGGMSFKAIAKSQHVSINTIQARYRYGLDKLQSMLNSEVKK